MGEVTSRKPIHAIFIMMPETNIIIFLLSGNKLFLYWIIDWWYKIIDNHEICISFNIFFVNIGPSLAKIVELYPDKDSRSFLWKSIVNYIYINPITEDEVINIVSKFKNGYCKKVYSKYYKTSHKYFYQYGVCRCRCPDE
jgi:hypothetical protein